MSVAGSPAQLALFIKEHSPYEPGVKCEAKTGRSGLFRADGHYLIDLIFSLKGRVSRTRAKATSSTVHQYEQK